MAPGGAEQAKETGLLVLSSIRAALAQRLGRPVSASVVWRRLWARTGATRPIESGQSICYYPGQFYLLLTLLGLDPAHYPQGRMSYDLRRLRLHGLIQRIPHSHRYEPTTLGLRVALFFSRTYARLLRPILADIAPSAPLGHSPIRAAFERLQTLIDQACQEAQLATG